MGAAIRTILLSDWDPLLVRDVSVAQDEYDAYVGPITGLIERKAPVIPNRANAPCISLPGASRLRQRTE